MSFISDTLKKVSYDGGGGDTPPPGIQNNKPDNKSPLKYILLGALGFIAALGIAGVFFSDQIVSFLHPPVQVAEQTPYESPAALADVPDVTDSPASTDAAVPADSSADNLSVELVMFAGAIFAEQQALLQNNVIAALLAEAPPVEPPQTTPASAGTVVSATPTPTVSMPEGVPPEVVSYSPDLGMVMLVPDADSEVFKTNSLTARANNALRQGNNKAALEYFLEAYGYTQNSNIAYNIAFLYIQNKDPNAAVKWIENPILDETDKRDLIIEMIERSYRTEAEACIRNLIGADRYGNLIFASAYLNEVKGNIEKAAEEYRNAMIKSAYDPYVTYSYARSQDMLKNYQEAILHYNSVAQMSQDMSLKRAAQMRMNALSDMQRK